MAKRKTTPNLEPLGDRVLIKPFDESQLEAKTDAGIIIPETAKEDKPQQGEVIAVGEGRREDGELIAPDVAPGEKVVFSKYGYDEVTIGEEEYYLVRSSDIIAKIK